MPEASLSESLAGIPAGRRCRIVKIDGDKALVRRMLGLGLRAGTECEVVKRRQRGLVLATGGQRIAVGEEMMQHIFVEQL
jgi:ferrous iron transport protein A